MFESTNRNFPRFLAFDTIKQMNNWLRMCQLEKNIFWGWWGEVCREIAGRPTPRLSEAASENGRDDQRGRLMVDSPQKIAESQPLEP